MRFEWDPRKAASNIKKHGVRFPDVTGAFADPNAITLIVEGSDETRYVTIGLDHLLQLIVVVYTSTPDVIRIISARKATPNEARTYAGTT